jgi:hypothetical protein
LLTAVALSIAGSIAGCKGGSSAGETIAPPMTAIPVAAADATGADYPQPPPLAVPPGHTAIPPDGAPIEDPPEGKAPPYPPDLQSPFDPPPPVPSRPPPSGVDL